MSSLTWWSVSTGNAVGSSSADGVGSHRSRRVRRYSQGHSRSLKVSGRSGGTAGGRCCRRWCVSSGDDDDDHVVSVVDTRRAGPRLVTVVDGRICAGRSYQRLGRGAPWRCQLRPAAAAGAAARVASGRSRTTGRLYSGRRGHFVAGRQGRYSVTKMLKWHSANADRTCVLGSV